MGQAITSLGSNNLLGMFGVNDALMHMFPDTHKNIVDRLTLKNIIFPGIDREYDNHLCKFIANLPFKLCCHIK